MESREVTATGSYFALQDEFYDAYQAAKQLKRHYVYIHLFSWGRLEGYVAQWKAAWRKRTRSVETNEMARRVEPLSVVDEIKEIKRIEASPVQEENSFLKDLEASVNRYEAAYPHYFFLRRFWHWLTGYTKEMQLKKQWVIYEKSLSPLRACFNETGGEEVERKCEESLDIIKKKGHFLPPYWRKIFSQLEKKIGEGLEILRMIRFCQKKRNKEKVSEESKSEMRNPYAKARAYLGLPRDTELDIKQINKAYTNVSKEWSPDQPIYTGTKIFKFKNNTLGPLLLRVNKILEDAKNFLCDQLEEANSTPVTIEAYDQYRAQYQSYLKQKKEIDSCIRSIYGKPRGEIGPPRPQPLPLYGKAEKPKDPEDSKVFKRTMPGNAKDAKDKKDKKDDGIVRTEEDNQLIFHGHIIFYFLGLDPQTDKLSAVKEKYNHLRMKMHSDKFFQVKNSHGKEIIGEEAKEGFLAYHPDQITHFRKLLDDCFNLVGEYKYTDDSKEVIISISEVIEGLKNKFGFMLPGTTKSKKAEEIGLKWKKSLSHLESEMIKEIRVDTLGAGVDMLREGNKELRALTSELRKLKEERSERADKILRGIGERSKRRDSASQEIGEITAEWDASSEERRKGLEKMGKDVAEIKKSFEKWEPILVYLSSGKPVTFSSTGGMPVSTTASSGFSTAPTPATADEKAPLDEGTKTMEAQPGDVSMREPSTPLSSAGLSTLLHSADISSDHVSPSARLSSTETQPDAVEVRSPATCPSALFASPALPLERERKEKAEEAEKRRRKYEEEAAERWRLLEEKQRLLKERLAEVEKQRLKDKTEIAEQQRLLEENLLRAGVEKLRAETGDVSTGEPSTPLLSVGSSSILLHPADISSDHVSPSALPSTTAARPGAVEVVLSPAACPSALFASPAPPMATCDIMPPDKQPKGPSLSAGSPSSPSG